MMMILQKRCKKKLLLHELLFFIFFRVSGATSLVTTARFGCSKKCFARENRKTIEENRGSTYLSLSFGSFGKSRFARRGIGNFARSFCCAKTSKRMQRVLMEATKLVSRKKDLRMRNPLFFDRSLSYDFRGGKKEVLKTGVDPFSQLLWFLRCCIVIGLFRFRVERFCREKQIRNSLSQTQN